MGVAKNADIQLSVIRSESRDRRAKRVREQAIEAGLGDEIAQLFYNLIARAIRIEPIGKFNAIIINSYGDIGTISCGDYANSSRLAGAEFAKPEEASS